MLTQHKLWFNHNLCQININHNSKTQANTESDSEMLLIKNGEVFGPAPLGKADILVGGGKILAIEERLDTTVLPGKIDEIEADNMLVLPGFVDGHQHFTGGGGEGGFQTRTPEMTLSMNIRNGVTTAVGLLGTDSLTRSVEDLFAKTKALTEEGMTAVMLTGSYWLPSPTICGSVDRDLVFLDPVIGVKLALADQRGPTFDAKDLAVLASDVRVASLISGKRGNITVHIGSNTSAMGLIFNAIDIYEIRPDIFIPTHINKGRCKCSEQSLKMAEMGAIIDATAVGEQPAASDSKVSAADFALIANDNKLFDQVAISSDSGGSLPKWNDDKSHILGMEIGNPSSLLVELKRLISSHHIPLDKALRPLTVTPARAYGFTGKKGIITVNADADLLVLNPEDFEIRDVVACGQVMLKNGVIEKKGYFE